MGRRGQRKSAAGPAGAKTAAREGLEIRWRGRITYAHDLASLVTAVGAAREPFHRWVHLAQGFSPELVRLFLRETAGRRPGAARAPLLDPFSGSGTVVIECARQGVRAIGVEAAQPLVFLTTATAETDLSPLPVLDTCASWEAMADRLDVPIHRAALMLAVARRHTSAGKLNKNAPPLPPVLEQVAAMMRDDLRRPLPVRNLVLPGDARRLDMISDGSVAGILTSPPYLSRHDYTQILRPYELVYRRWYPGPETARPRPGQLRAHPDATNRKTPASDIHEAAAEASAALSEINETRLAGLVPAHFDDLRRVLGECARVLRPGGTCWLVIGGARLKGVYVPSDLIAAELAESRGLSVGMVRVARNLIDVGRKLGRLTNVTPRESILILTKR